MNIQESLHAAKFVVNEKGERTAVVLPVDVWNTLVEWVNQNNPNKPTPKPVESLEELWGNFWPKDEPVDDFIDAVDKWRQEDLALHRELE